MARIAPPPAPKLFFILFLLSAASLPPAVHSLSYSQYKTLISLSHSVLTRVANLRASRGDFSGSDRVRIIADKLERAMGLGFLATAWSVGWDYARNYAWRELDYGEMYGAASDVNELIRVVSELTRAGTDSERAASLSQNYENVLRVSKRILRRLAKVFTKSGALREVIETVQIEVVEGGLVRDCLDLSNKDLKSLLQILKDLAVQYTSSSYNSEEL